MLPGWPALCLVCQGEGLFGLHQEGLCVCDKGGRDKEQAGQTLVQISEAVLSMHGQVLASLRETDVSLSLLSCFCRKAEGESDTLWF